MIKTDFVRGIRVMSIMAFFGVFSPANVSAEFALSLGYDFGLSQTDAPIRFVEEPLQRDSDRTSIGLGADFGFLWEFTPDYFLGLTFDASLYAAGPEPSSGLDILVGPKFTFRPVNWLFLDTNIGVVASSFDDSCEEDAVLSSGRADCDDTVPSEPGAVGMGASFSALVDVFVFEDLHLLVGPTFRYRRARFDYETLDDSFLLQTFQATLGVRMFVHIQ